MKKAVSIAVALLLSALHSLAAGSDFALQWARGNEHYQQKQYDSALYYYEQIAAAKPNNASVYYNLGNTYYRLNNIARAVLNYERALHIKPDYKEAKENLLLTQSRINNRIPNAGDIFFINWWQSVTAPDKATMWAVIALITFLMIIGISALKIFRRGKGTMLPGQVQGVLGFICACFLVLAFCASKNMEQTAGAVVMSANVPLMGNDLKGKPALLIPEGTTVKLLSKKDSWREVRLPDGRTGWLQENMLEKI
jgi:hypothetical protein